MKKRIDYLVRAITTFGFVDDEIFSLDVLSELVDELRSGHGEFVIANEIASIVEHLHHCPSDTEEPARIIFHLLLLLRFLQLRGRLERGF